MVRCSVFGTYTLEKEFSGTTKVSSFLEWVRSEVPTCGFDLHINSQSLPGEKTLGDAGVKEAETTEITVARPEETLNRRIEEGKCALDEVSALVSIFPS